MNKLLAARWILAFLLAGSLRTAPGQTVIATIDTGPGPIDAAVNPVTDRIYVSNSFPGSVAGVDGTTHSVIATIPVGLVATGIGVNPATNRVM